ncbi:MAG: HU family DNA-binding protein [Herpetosiphon sp.]
MQKTEFIAEVAERANVSKKDARQVIDTALKLITEKLQAGERIVLTGFGTFEVRDRQARQGVNPQTKERMDINATRTPGFSASNSLKESVRGGEQSTGRRRSQRGS